MELLLKILASALSLLIATWITPGMKISGGYGTAVFAAIVIGLIDWALLKYTDLKASPKGRGSTGFFVAAIVLYVTGMIVKDFHVSIFGALIGAAILGFIDSVAPWGKLF
ncbi:MAG: phage holin family protein [Tissierellia bacterium]|nr:phage holin family protein [Tissierellia bacterium]